MPATKPLHPSKLYALLRDCTDAQARATAIVSFLVGSSEARAGFVLLSRHGELVLAASSDQKELPDALMVRARALWASDQAAHSEADRTRTMDVRPHGSTLVESQEWQAPDGERYTPRVLGSYRDSRWIPVGVAALSADAKEPRRIRHAHVDVICNALLDCGDVVHSSG